MVISVMKYHNGSSRRVGYIGSRISAGAVVNLLKEFADKIGCSIDQIIIGADYNGEIEFYGPLENMNATV